MSIRRKYLISALVVLLVLWGIALTTGWFIRQRQVAQVKSSVALVADFEKERVTAALDRSTAELSLAAQARDVANHLADHQIDPSSDRALERFVRDVVPLLGGVKALTIVDANGERITDSSLVAPGFAPRISSGPDVERAIAGVRESGRPRVSRAAMLAPDDSRFLHVIPVLDRLGVRGVLIAECDFAEIQQVTDGSRVVGMSADTMLVERTGANALIVNQPSDASPAAFSTSIALAGARHPAALAIDAAPGTYDDAVGADGEPAIAAVRRIADSPWAIAVTISRSDAYAGVQRELRLGVIGFAIAGAFVLLAFVASFTSLSRRVRRVGQSARALSDGDLSARVSDNSRDELGELARSFNKMADTIVADMAHRRQAEADLEHSARHDPLTGLPNRIAFDDELNLALLHAASPGEVAVLFCDLDDFKVVNDDLGHSAGDALLRDVTARLRRATGPQHVLARFGGDEFVVVARGLHEPGDAARLGERMAEALSSTGITLAGREVFVTTSVGVAIGQRGSTAETLVRDADAAMYQAKRIGRNRVVLHDATIQARANNRVAMGSELQRAISQEGLTMALQTIVDFETGDVHAFEALVRWKHEGREIDPSEFVLRATELDLAGALDRWVLAEACRTMMTIDPTPFAEIGWLHVNVTGTSLVDVDFAEDVLQILRRHGIAPSALCLEIVEDRLSVAPALALRNLDRLRREGVRVAIDDFGTGHSSLARLRDLPADTVKIDQAFIRDIATDQTALAITTAVISLAQRLGLEVVAEGIETDEQRRALASIGCRYGQGFLLGFPFPAAELAQRFPAIASVSERVPRLVR